MQSDDVVEAVARALVVSSAGERAADHAREFDTITWREARREARAAIAAHDTALKAQVEALREAMKPFADEADKYDPEQEDGDEEAFASHFLLMDLRRARAALAATEPKP